MPNAELVQASALRGALREVSPAPEFVQGAQEQLLNPFRDEMLEAFALDADLYRAAFPELVEDFEVQVGGPHARLQVATNFLSDFITDKMLASFEQYTQTRQPEDAVEFLAMYDFYSGAMSVLFTLSVLGTERREEALAGLVQVAADETGELQGAEGVDKYAELMGRVAELAELFDQDPTGFTLADALANPEVGQRTLAQLQIYYVPEFVQMGKEAAAATFKAAYPLTAPERQ